MYVVKAVKLLISVFTEQSLFLLSTEEAIFFVFQLLFSFNTFCCRVPVTV